MGTYFYLTPLTQPYLISAKAVSDNIWATMAGPVHVESIKTVHVVGSDPITFIIYCWRQAGSQRLHISALLTLQLSCAHETMLPTGFSETVIFALTDSRSHRTPRNGLWGNFSLSYAKIHASSASGRPVSQSNRDHPQRIHGGSVCVWVLGAGEACPNS